MKYYIMIFSFKLRFKVCDFCEGSILSSPIFVKGPFRGPRLLSKVRFELADFCDGSVFGPNFLLDEPLHNCWKKIWNNNYISFVKTRLVSYDCSVRSLYFSYICLFREVWFLNFVQFHWSYLLCLEWLFTFRIWQKSCWSLKCLCFLFFSVQYVCNTELKSRSFIFSYYFFFLSWMNTTVMFLYFAYLILLQISLQHLWSSSYGITKTIWGNKKEKMKHATAHDWFETFLL